MQSPSKFGSYLIAALGIAVIFFLALIANEMSSSRPIQRPPKAAVKLPAAGSADGAGNSVLADKTIPRPPSPLPQKAAGGDLLTEQIHNEGLTHFTRGEYSDAVSLFQKALDRDSQNPAIRNNLAAALGSQAWAELDAGDYREALGLFQSAINLNPVEASLFLGQGLAYHRLHDPDRAVLNLKRTIELDPKNPTAYQLLGAIYQEQDEMEMAVGYYEKGLELAPTNTALRTQLAKARREQSVQSEFQHESSRAFTVKFEGREEREAASRILQDLDEAYGKIGKALSFYPQKTITVILYSNQQFRDVTRSAPWSKGIFDGKIRISIGGSERTPDALRRTLFHEYVHAVVYELSRGQAVPRWLNEGLAVYLSEEDSTRESYLLRQIQSGGPLIPLVKLHGSFMNFSDDEAALAYAESYSAVKMLVDRHGLYRLRQLLENLGSSRDFESAFSDQYLNPYERFQSDWQGMVRTASGGAR